MELVRLGFDITVGIRMKRERSALVLDILEPARTAADRVFLKFMRGGVFPRTDFTVRGGLVNLIAEIGPLLTNWTSRMAMTPR